MEITISTTALITSLVSVIWTIWYNNRQRKLQPMFNYLTQIVSIESQVGQNSELLKCHGIDPKDLKDLGVSPEQFGYMLTSFTLGHAWFLAYGYGKKDTKPFQKGSYRYHMITSEPAIKAWPILKTLISDTNYKRKLELTIEQTKRAIKDNKSPTSQFH